MAAPKATPFPRQDEPLTKPNGIMQDGWYKFLFSVGTLLDKVNGSFSQQIGDAKLGSAAVEDVGANGHTLPFLDAQNTWGRSQRFDPVVLTYDASIAWDWNLGPIASVTLTGNAFLALPTNLGAKAGTWSLYVYQDAVGGRTLTYNNAYFFPLGADPVLSTGANALDILTFVYNGVHIVGSAVKQLS